MGVLNQFEAANEYLRKVLGYHLDPNGSDKFRSLLNLAGIRRVKHAIDLIELQGLRGAPAHPHVVQRIWSLMPPKRSKYRNPQAEAARKMNIAQRREMEYAMSRDKD